MNGNNGGILHLDKPRERRKTAHDENAGNHNAGKTFSVEDIKNKRTFGKTPDGTGE
jgi:hypothetical protein